jgi:hypothetical protein
MKNLRRNRNLAHEIGLCRIAMVVDRLCGQIQTHPVLREHFGVVGDWGSYRARLTYFWWIVLGGKGLRTISFDAVPTEAQAGLDTDLSRDWIVLFRQVAFSIVGEELTEAWIQEVEQLRRRLGIADNDSSSKLARAS